MQKEVWIDMDPVMANDHLAICKQIAEELSCPLSMVTGYTLLKKTIDARSKKQIIIKLKLQAFINEPVQSRQLIIPNYRSVKNVKQQVIIIGCGPAGLFAALTLIEQGIKPIIIERGKQVRERRRDLAVLNQKGMLNADSNYCFGEGGAGTYSDGKLFTRSNKRGDTNKILSYFVHFGAPENILFDAHPHIGTNKLPQIISNMRAYIEQCGGEILFNTKLIDLHLEKNTIRSIVTNTGEEISGSAYLLATGHSARDIYELLAKKNILIVAKPLALGVRIEHPQKIIDDMQYHGDREKYAACIPPASYSIVEQVNQRGVFSFCMCPGGIIALASTQLNELVINGWSPSKRNNPFANSGMVVSLTVSDMHLYLKENKDKLCNNHIPFINNDHPLLSMAFQSCVEQRAYQLGGGNFVAPAQRLVDYCNHKTSNNLPDCSYIPGLQSANLHDILPPVVATALKDALLQLSKNKKQYFTNEAVMVATESRTSSPVRIPRNDLTGSHIQIANLFPCGEGAGYAGGIMSAAMDGEYIATKIVGHLSVN
ncbi:MAG: FAD-dependent monooxygenase [Phycisphaerales bacterium]|nr:FAD-dependent monooxygenase [Phycisphaerales bacterium]